MHGADATSYRKEHLMSRPNNPNKAYPFGVGTQCPFCGKKKVICLTEAETQAYWDWKDRKLLIQEAFPNMSKAEREMLKTGICEECWGSFLCPTTM
jgi:hypothetical protein